MDEEPHHEAFVEKCGTILKFWQHALWHTELAVIPSLSVCKGIYMKDCIKVQSVVFQIIVDSIGLNGYILKWWNASRKFLEKIMALKGAF